MKTTAVKRDGRKPARTVISRVVITTKEGIKISTFGAYRKKP